MSLASEVDGLAGSLGLHVREARLRRRWTTHELAAKIGVSERTVRKVEQGAISVAVGTVLSACVLLDVDLEREVSAHVRTKRAPRRAPDIARSETDF